MAPEKECLLLALSETLRGDGCWILFTLSAQQGAVHLLRNTSLGSR